MARDHGARRLTTRATTLPGLDDPVPDPPAPETEPPTDPPVASEPVAPRDPHRHDAPARALEERQRRWYAERARFEESRARRAQSTQ